MASTPDALETGGATFVASEDTALSLDPSAAPLLRKAMPEIDEKPVTRAQHIITGVFVFAPMLALLAAIPFAWGWGLGWHDIVIGAVFYWVSGLGITVGYHRYFTHSSFKANTAAGGARDRGQPGDGGPGCHLGGRPPRHHKYSDKEGDPHSPWRYGDDAKALAKGLVWAHVLWLFDPNQTSQQKFVPDLLADRKIRLVDAWFPGLVRVLAPCPRDHRRLLDLRRGLVLARCHRGVLLGQPGPHHAAAPCDLVHQLDLPHLG